MPRGRLLLVVGVALGAVLGLVLGLLIGYLAYRAPAFPRVDEVGGTVLTVSADGDTVAIRRADGTDESFQIPATPGEVEMLQRGESVRLDVVRFHDRAVVVGIEPESPTVSAEAP